MGLNHFADWSEEESNKMMSGVKPAAKDMEAEQIDVDTDNLDLEVDWRVLYRPARNQGSCGSCWAFTAMGTVEGTAALKAKVALSDYVSTQQQVDCVTTNHGCNGGDPGNALDWSAANGNAMESQYAYTAKAGACKSEIKGKVLIAGSKWLGVAVAKPAYQAIVALGPQNAMIHANAQFQAYSSGVFKPECTQDVNHGVVAVGYGVDLQFGFYWIVRNSWSTEWGMSGYAKVADDGSSPNGCGIRGYVNQVLPL
jgi:C1A family cysteine protease